MAETDSIFVVVADAPAEQFEHLGNLQGCTHRSKGPCNRTPTQPYVDRCLSISILLAGVIGASCAHAESVTITDAPAAFSASGPAGWSRQPPATGNSRLKYASPSGTPYAECAVIVNTSSALRGLSQLEMNTVMLAKPDPEAIARHLASSFGNVRVISVGNSLLSGFPGQIYNVSYSVGSPAGPKLVRSVTTSTMTAPDVGWTVTCGGQGQTLAEAQKAFDYWQSEFVKFPTFIKFIP